MRQRLCLSTKSALSSVDKTASQQENNNTWMLGRGWLCIKLEPGPLRSFNFEFFWKGDFNWQIGLLFSWKGDFNWQIGVFSLERASLITKLGYFSLERTALIGKLGYFSLERAALIGKLKNFSLERVTLKKILANWGIFLLKGGL